MGTQALAVEKAQVGDVAPLGVGKGLVGDDAAVATGQMGEDAEEMLEEGKVLLGKVSVCTLDRYHITAGRTEAAMGSGFSSRSSGQGSSKTCMSGMGSSSLLPDMTMVETGGSDVQGLSTG